ncbi:MAG: hypothetical protein KAJ73_00345 [Zetaproteobacteria bacterium]|nr:hypothetical protein [Zetaproteobacteria bacterium]
MATVNPQTSPKFPASKIYDPASSVGEDANTSNTVRGPSYVAIEGMAPTLTSVTLQVKIHPDADWHDYLDIDVTTPNALVEFSGNQPPNFVRVVRVGAGDFVVYAQ